MREVSVVAETALFRGLPETMDVWMSHGDEAEALPEGFALTAKTSNAVAGIADEARKIWAVQFHPEVAHTPAGHGAAAELLRWISAGRSRIGRRNILSSRRWRGCGRRWAMAMRSAG